MSRKNKFFISGLIVVLAFSLLGAPAALADDSTPPATESPVATEVPAATEEPAATEAPAAPESALPGESSAPQALPEEVAAALEDLPAEVGLLVLDEHGDGLALASEEAAQALAAPDPYFTSSVDGLVYGFTQGASCPAVVDVCSANLVTPAISAAVANFVALGGSGLIYVESGTYSESVTVNGVSGLTGILGVSGSGATTLNGNVVIQNMNDFTLQGFTINGGVSAFSNSGTLSLIDLDVTNPFGEGISVYHAGNVYMEDIVASDNQSYGAYVSAGGGVTIAGENEFNRNGSTGLISISSDDINVNSITASDNDGYGVYLHSFFGSVTMTGVNVFEGNRIEGLYAVADGDMTLSNVTAMDNGCGDCGFGGGAVLYSVGDLTLNGNNVFARNVFYGLTAYAGCNLAVEKIAAYENGDRDFSIAADGATLYSDNVTIKNGCFYNNTDYGLSVYPLSPSGVLTLTNVGGYGNDGGDLYLGKGETLVGSMGGACGGGSGGAVKPTKPFQKIESPTAPFSPNCGDFSGLILALPNGDKVVFFCEIPGAVSSEKVEESELPGALPAGTFISALHTSVEGSPLPLMKVSFALPAEDGEYAIFYWDGTAWKELGGEKNAASIDATVSFTGVFVLVKK
ncbi:MAG: hypothetical protein Fur002_11900 [Anaerolineales bacterium]